MYIVHIHTDWYITNNVTEYSIWKKFVVLNESACRDRKRDFGKGITVTSTCTTAGSLLLVNYGKKTSRDQLYTGIGESEFPVPC